MLLIQANTKTEKWDKADLELATNITAKAQTIPNIHCRSMLVDAMWYAECTIKWYESQVDIYITQWHPIFLSHFFFIKVIRTSRSTTLARNSSTDNLPHPQGIDGHWIELGWIKWTRWYKCISISIYTCVNTDTVYIYIYMCAYMVIAPSNIYVLSIAILTYVYCTHIWYMYRLFRHIK